MINIIRNAVKAVIIENKSVLLIKHERDNLYYTLPGGGQEHNETMQSALKRECFEELGGHVEVNELIHVTEYIADHDDNTIHKKGFHQIDMFLSVAC